MTNALSYRPEIDGLRAIAVSAVVLYHAEFIVGRASPVSGGYLGVDIFFVISGYLITSILVTQMLDGTFSFGAFYKRRIRRLLPALMAVILPSLVLGWGLLLPLELVSFAKSLLSTLVFGANFWFWSDIGYWQADSARVPFLHMWSLAVEEQYYLLFPLFLTLLLPWSLKTTVRTVFWLGLASLVLAQILVVVDEEAGFYLLPSRAWELLAGSYLAVRQQTRLTQPSQRSATLWPLVGIFLIGLSIVAFNASTDHPSLLTLIPVGGTMLIIWYCTGRDITSRVLGSRPFVFVGLVSYSFYLWHYPVFAFFRIRYTTYSVYDIAGWIGIAFGLSVFSYYLVERPFRRILPFKAVLAFVLASSLVTVAFSVQVIRANGYPDRMPEILSEDFTQYPWLIMKNDAGQHCFGDYGKSEFCQFRADTAQGQMILVGDSTTEALSVALTPKLLAASQSVTSLNSSACFFMPGFRAMNSGVPRIVPDTPCDVDYQARRLARIADQPGATVLLGGAFDYYLENTSYGFEPETGTQSIADGYVAAVTALLEAGHTVVQVAPFPRFEENVSQEIQREIREIMGSSVAPRDGTGFESFEEQMRAVLAYPIQRYWDQTAQAFGVFARIEHPNYSVVDIQSLFCDTLEPETCVTNNGKQMFFADQLHPAKLGGEMIAERVMAHMRRIGIIDAP